MKIPEGTGERQTRPSTQALRRYRRGAVVFRGGEGLASAAATGGSPEVRGQGDAAKNGESGQAGGKGKGGRRRIGPRESESGHGIGPSRPDPWSARLQKVRATLDRARRFEAWTLAGVGRTPADVARREKLTRARVSQILRLLKLAPEIIEDVERPGRTGRTLGELELRGLSMKPRKDQVRQYRALLGLDESGRVTQDGAVAEA